MKRVVPAEYEQHLTIRQTSVLGEGSRVGLSMRGFWIGAFLSLFLAAGAPYVNLVMRATFMAFDFTATGAVFLFLVLIGVLNTAFKLAAKSQAAAVGLALAAVGAYLAWHRPLTAIDPLSPGVLLSTFLVASTLLNVPLALRGKSLALNRSELVLVFVMLLIVTALCTMGLSHQLMPMLTALFYYAAPDNRWAERLIPNLPEHALLVDDGADNRAFYEGVAQAGTDIPYAAWVEPLIWWGVFLMALYMCMVSVAVILRRQWMEHERLPYPLTQVPLAMVEGEREAGLVNGFFKSRGMWAGCAIPMVIGTMRAVHFYDPTFPYPDLNTSTSLFGLLDLPIVLHFSLIGFSYLINTQVAAGIWLFYLVARVEKEILQTVGMESTQTITYGVSDVPSMAYQGVGALLAMVLLGLWVGREHLKSVVLKALGRAPHVDDSDEIMSYRSAVIGVAGGMMVMTGWLWLMGTKFWVSLVFVVLALLIFVGITRILAEAGLAAVRAPMIAPDLTMMGLGSQLVGTSGALNLSLAYLWSADLRVFVMAMCANGLKLIEAMDIRSRRLVFRGIVLAILLGAVGSCWTVLHLAYEHGGINMNDWFFKESPAAVYNLALRNIVEPTQVDWQGLGFFFGGGLAMGVLTWARQRWLWWPVHPIGFPIGGNFMMDRVWSNVFIAWAVKSLVLRFGGAAAYRHSQRFFLGLIAGEALCNGVWLVIDYCTGAVGNQVFLLG